MQTWATAGTGSSESMFAGLDTNTSVNDDASNVTAGTTEPSSSNGYSRPAITWGSATNGSLDAAVTVANSASISWTSSGGAFSTGATTLKVLTIWNTATLASANDAAFCGRATIAVPQAVNAAGITLTVAIGGLVMGLTSG